MEKAVGIKTLFKSPVASYTDIEESQDSNEEEIRVQSLEEDSTEVRKDNFVLQTKKYELSPLEAVASAIALEEAADEIAILGHMADLPNVEADLTYKTLDDRFNSLLADAQIFDPETIEPYEVAMDKQKFIKFQTDRSFVEKILREVVVDLIKESSYKCLVKHLTQYDRKFYEENQLLDKEMQNKAKLQELHTMLESERRQALAEIQYRCETIGNLKDQFEDTIFENKIKENYIETWENSRIEQNNYYLDKQEDVYLNIINKGKADIERETRVDAEVESFVIESQREYEELILQWMERYDREIELRDTEIQVLKEKREEQFNRLQEISQLYDKHKLEIQLYLELKEKRREEAELLEKQIKAAIKIQAWWRGTMVRKGFGRFRKKKGKKDKGADKKKGKK